VVELDRSTDKTLCFSVLSAGAGGATTAQPEFIPGDPLSDPSCETFHAMSGIFEGYEREYCELSAQVTCKTGALTGLAAGAPPTPPLSSPAACLRTVQLIERCSAGVEDQGAEEVLWGQKENRHVSFWKPALVRAALLSTRTRGGPHYESNTSLCSHCAVVEVGVSLVLVSPGSGEAA